MNLKPKFNQKQKQNHQKQNLEQSTGLTYAIQPLEQQNQHSCCNSDDEALKQYVNAGTKKPAGLTAEKLKSFPGLADLSDQQAEEIAESLILLSQLTYEMFQVKQREEEQQAIASQQVERKRRVMKQQPGCNKTVAFGTQAKQQLKVNAAAQELNKINRVTSKITI